MESAIVYELRGSCTEDLKTRGDSFIWTYNSATSTTAGPLAQSAERGADNAKVVSSTLTRTTKRIFFFYLIFSLRNLISADKSVFFSFLKSRFVFTQIRTTQSTSLIPRRQGWCPRGDEMKLQNREKIRLLKPKILPLLNIAGPLAQSAERGADNAKVVSSTLTRTTRRMFFLRNLISVDKSVFFLLF